MHQEKINSTIYKAAKAFGNSTDKSYGVKRRKYKRLINVLMNGTNGYNIHWKRKMQKEDRQRMRKLRLNPSINYMPTKG